MTTRKIIVFIIGLCLILIISTTIRVAVNITPQVKKHSLPPPTPVTTSSPPTDGSQQIIQRLFEPDVHKINEGSPQGSAYAYFEYYDTARPHIKPNTLRLIVSPFWNDGTNNSNPPIDCVILIEDNPDQIFNANTLWEQTLTIPNQYLEYLQNLSQWSNQHQFQNTLAWSNDGLSLAFLSPDTLFIYQFDVVENINSQLFSTCHTALKLINTFSTPLPWLNEDQSLLLFFAGDDSELYIATNTLYRYSLSTKQLTEITRYHPDSSNIYPIPNQQGIIYSTRNFPSESATTDGIVIDTFDRQQVYKLSQRLDGITNIILSPNHQHVCVEQRASGSWWYSVFELPSTKLIIESGTYSHCQQWIDNQQLLITENPYNSSTYSQTSIINVNTLTKTPLSLPEPYLIQHLRSLYLNQVRSQ